MNEKEYAKVIAANLRRIAYEHGKTQADMCRDLGINQGTLSSWMVGTRTPRMSKIDMLCQYFGCSRNDLMEPYVPKPVGKITGTELKIIQAFRDAPEGVQDSILILLGLKERT